MGKSNGKKYPAWLRIRTTRKTRGLTLIELMVVCLILTLLVGILLPILNGLGRKAEAAAVSTGLGEATKIVSLNKALGDGLGSRWDSLVDTSANLYTGLSPAAAASLTLSTPLTAPQANTFIDAGITETAFMAVTTTDKTNLANSITTPTGNIGTGAVLAVLNPTVVQDQLGITPDPLLTYIAMGMGMKNSLIGTRMQDAPLATVGERNPIDVYSRFILVFGMPTTPTAGQKVRFIGTLDAELKGLQYSQTKFNAKSTE